MTLREIIEIADSAYPEGFILQAYAHGEAPDTLAESICFNLETTFEATSSDERQIDMALDTLYLLREDLNRVIKAFEDKQ